MSKRVKKRGKSLGNNELHAIFPNGDIDIIIQDKELVIGKLMDIAYSL
jgi:hypothetical protein